MRTRKTWMKMRKFTDKELELAPMVAEVMGFSILIEKGGSRLEYMDGKRVENAVHIPLEHDCLEWLRKHQFDITMFLCQSGGVVELAKEWGDLEYKKSADTLLEALYRVIISVGNQTCGENEKKGE